MSEDTESTITEEEDESVTDEIPEAEKVDDDKIGMFSRAAVFTVTTATGTKAVWVRARRIRKGARYERKLKLMHLEDIGRKIEDGTLDPKNPKQPTITDIMSMFGAGVG